MRDDFLIYPCLLQKSEEIMVDARQSFSLTYGLQVYSYLQAVITFEADQN